MILGALRPCGVCRGRGVYRHPAAAVAPRHRGGTAIKAVLFDIDGTILKCHGAGKRSLERAAMDIFGTAGLMDSVDFQGKTDPLILYESLVPAGVGREEIRANMDRLKDRYLFYLDRLITAANVTLLPGVLPLLRELSANDSAVLGLLTGNFSAGARIKLSAHGLGGYFRFGVFGDDTAVRNEMPAIARERIRGLLGADIGFGEMVIIGDTVHDIECGKNAGAVSIAVGTGWTEERELVSMKPDFYFPDLSDKDGVLSAIFDGRGPGTAE